MKDWLVYMIRCSDDSLDTGITNDLEKRFRQHTEGKGAKYFRGRRPKEVVHVEQCPDRSSASKREAQIKKLTPEQKRSLVGTGHRKHKRHRS